MEENNLRVLRVWRTYIPNRSWWQYRSRMSKLNNYVTSLLQDRWRDRQAGARDTRHRDVLDTIMAMLEVCWVSPINIC